MVARNDKFRFLSVNFDYNVTNKLLRHIQEFETVFIVLSGKILGFTNYIGFI